MPVASFLPENEPVAVTGIEICTDGTLPELFNQERELVREGWARRTVANPHLFNGSAFLTGEIKLDCGLLFGRAARTDYANFLHWRGNAPFQAAVGLHHIFPAAAIESADGMLIAVQASQTTVNAGKVYFAGGNFDDDDVLDGRLDPHRNMAREVMEETGLDLCAMKEGDGWVAVRSNRFVAVFRSFKSGLSTSDGMPFITIGRQTSMIISSS